MASLPKSLQLFEFPEVKPACYVCGASHLRMKFTVPLHDGPYKDDPVPELRTLYECDTCGHLSADVYDSRKYSAYYASLAESYHSFHDHDCSRYAEVLRFLPKRPLMRVLDLGCGTGTFLAMLPPEIERFGIEPSQAAADRARAIGAEIVQYDDLTRPGLRNSFDLVTAIDVVEHVADLIEFRRHISNALRPGGTLIILTGDCKSRPARFLGRYWSYLNFAEHITVFCRRSMRTWLEPDFSAIDLRTTNHHPLGAREGLTLIRIWSLFPVKWLVRKVMPVGVDMFVALSLPGDHMLVRATRK